MSLEEVGGLLKAMHATLPDCMYTGLGDSKGRSFLGHLIIGHDQKRMAGIGEEAIFFSRGPTKMKMFGRLKELMDKRRNLLLKRACQSVMNNLKPTMATCVARNLEHWFNLMKAHVTADSPKRDVLDSFTTLSAAVSYIADALAEPMRMSARSAALTLC